MSLDKCFTELELGGKIDAPRSKEARALYNELYVSFRRSHGEDAAASLASRETVRQLEAAAAHKKRNLVRQVQAQAGGLKRIREFDGGDGTGPLDPGGLLALLDRSDRAGHNDNLVARSREILGNAHALTTELLFTFRSTVTGRLRNRAQAVEIVRELFEPGSTKSLAARELAEAWTKAAEYLRARFNEAGGRIGKLENWGLPQTHDWQKVFNAGFDTWRDFILPRLDRGRMIDRRTGLPFTDEGLELALRDVFETISTDGLSKVKPGAQAGKMLANQRLDHRFLHFRNADAWLEYNKDFGAKDPIASMFGHMRGMSQEIARLELLGPNPDATMRYLQDAVRVSAKNADVKARRRAKVGAYTAGKLYEQYTGELGAVVNDKIAMGFSAFRGWQTAAKLGMAVISSFSDQGTGFMARRFNGLPVLNQLNKQLSYLNPLSAADRKFAVRAGMIAEEWSNRTAAQYRYLGEELTGEWSRRLATGVIKGTGLSALTQHGRWGFGMDYLGRVSDLIEDGRTWSSLPRAMRRQFERHGISETDWQTFGRADMESYKGTKWLLPQNIEGEAGRKLSRLIHSETDFAVPVSDLRSQAIVNTLAAKGTWHGEAARSAFQFKAFPLAVLFLHARRAIELGGTQGAVYAAQLVIATTLMGALALQLKEIAKGRDPRPMDGDHAAEFWGAAMLQGGGLGIFGDFLGSSENRYGGGFASTLAGPGVQSAQNVGDLTIGNAAKAIRGDNTDVGRDVVRMVRQETPGGNMWMSRLAFERLIIDQLQMQIDPDYRRSFRAAERRAKDKGQQFWWEPGETAPERLPAFQE